jgi:hypothetical protein
MEGVCNPRAIPGGFFWCCPNWDTLIWKLGQVGCDPHSSLELSPATAGLFLWGHPRREIRTPEKGWPGPARVRWFRTFAMNVSQIYDGDGEPVEMKIELEKEAAN